MAEDPVPIESGAADRLLFFSDAVVAIAITLLALALPVPSGETAGDLLRSARHQDSHYLAFVISFTVIAAAWSQHHHVLRYAERSDPHLRTLNMLWLLTIVLNPFATNLLTSVNHDTLSAHALRFTFYALLQVLANSAFLAIVHHMLSHRLQAEDTPAGLLNDTDRKGIAVIVGFALSIPALFVTREGWLIWFLAPLVIGQLRRGRLRRHERASA